MHKRFRRMREPNGRSDDDIPRWETNHCSGQFHATCLCFVFPSPQAVFAPPDIPFASALPVARPLLLRRCIWPKMCSIIAKQDQFTRLKSIWIEKWPCVERRAFESQMWTIVAIKSKRKSNDNDGRRHYGIVHDPDDSIIRFTSLTWE